METTRAATTSAPSFSWSRLLYADRSRGEALPTGWAVADREPRVGDGWQPPRTRDGLVRCQGSTGIVPPTVLERSRGDFAIDGSALMFNLAITVLATLVFGVGPLARNRR
jgi:hypothetical protein